MKKWPNRIYQTNPKRITVKIPIVMLYIFNLFFDYTVVQSTYKF